MFKQGVQRGSAESVKDRERTVRWYANSAPCFSGGRSPFSNRTPTGACRATSHYDDTWRRRADRYRSLLLLRASLWAFV